MDLRDPPGLFLALGELLHQDLLEIHGAMEPAVADFVDGLSKSDAKVLEAWVAELLSGKFTNSELKGIVNRAVGAWSFDTRGARSLLESLHTSLQQERRS